jgi:DNA-binding response OmpR family regulator
MAKILLVEDEQGLAGAVKSWLADEHHSVDIASTGLHALEKLGSTQYDLILLDWLLPELSGIDICRRYRERRGAAPIIMLTAKGSVFDKETGLDSGADDYITKPFHLRELSARIRALLRRPSKSTAAWLKVSHVELNPDSLRVTINGAPIHLLPKEFILLEILMRNQNKIMTADELLNQVWGTETEITTDTLRSNIKSLRRKIDSGQPSLIVTVHGVGYKMKSADAY